MEIHKRLQYVDFLKGFAILCVVVGHIAAFNPKCDLLIDFVYSFHMPLFFFISGFLFHKKNIVNIQKSIISKVKSLIRDCRLILSVVDAKRSSWYLMLRATSFNCFLLV